MAKAAPPAWRPPVQLSQASARRAASAGPRAPRTRKGRAPWLALLLLAALTSLAWLLRPSELGADGGPDLSLGGPAVPVERDERTQPSLEPELAGRAPWDAARPGLDQPHPEALLEGTPAWDRYMVWDTAYYARADASRIHVQAPRGAGELRAPLLAVGPSRGVGQAERAYGRPLRVRARPGAPVTFFAPDRGTFPNGEPTITVEADSEGLASTTFTFWISTSYYRVVAASPLSAGWVVFELQALDEAAWDHHVALLGSTQDQSP